MPNQHLGCFVPELLLPAQIPFTRYIKDGYHQQQWQNDKGKEIQLCICGDDIVAVDFPLLHDIGHVNDFEGNAGNTV
jgi:hypothetical protein